MVSTLVGFAQIPVWQGFEMNWTYNHRLNRLGSYIFQDTVFNTAATGLGKDSGWFNTHYLTIPSPGRQYNEMRIYKRMEAKENEIIHIQIDTVLPVSYHHSIFYLNGFDLIANNDADKLQMLTLGVKMVKGNYDTTFLRISASFLFNCQSIECDWINNEVDYDLQIFIGCISFPNEDYISYVKGEMLNGNETWTVKENKQVNKVQGVGESPQFITDLKLTLNKAHWYSGLSMYIDSTHTTLMKFEQYKQKMKKRAFYKPHAAFSKKTKGTAQYEMDAISLTHPENIQPKWYVFSGGLIWKGNNRSAFSKDAVRSKPIQ